MSEQAPNQIDIQDQPLLEYAAELKQEMEADFAPQITMPELPLPTHVDDRAVQIDVAYQNATYSQEWKDKLSNPGLLARFGRRVLNAAGVQSPKQKALKYHESIIENYTSEVGKQGSDISGVTAEIHDANREAALFAELADGSITTKTLEQAIVEANPEDAAYKARAAARHEKRAQLVEYTSSAMQDQRTKEIVAMERAAAMASGQRFGGMDELTIKTKMLEQSIAEQQATLDLLISDK